MIFDLEGENRDFVSVYRAAYPPKRLCKSMRAVPVEPARDWENPTAEPYLEHINLQKVNDRLPPRRRSPTAADYLDKVRSERPHLAKALPRDPPDEAVVERSKRSLLLSTYQLDIAKTLGEADSGLQEVRSEISLPLEYSVPETVQKMSFRDPRHYGSSDLPHPNLLTLPADNLGADEKERQRLRVRTGDSEYQTVIGKVGRQIIKEQFFGPPLPVEPPEDSPRTICSMILKEGFEKPSISNILI